MLLPTQLLTPYYSTNMPDMPESVDQDDSSEHSSSSEDGEDHPEFFLHATFPTYKDFEMRLAAYQKDTFQSLVKRKSVRYP